VSSRYRELDGELVLILIRLSGRGKSSRVELGQVQPNAAGVFHVRDGKVVKIALYWDRERASRPEPRLTRGRRSPAN
jgi:ketosteroid isomerase-like protein